MKKLIIVLIFISAICSNSQEIMRKPLNLETFKEWDKFIKDFAPSDSAFNVVVNFANRHYFSGRSILAREVYDMYRSYFPDKKDIFDNQIRVHTELALSQPITDDLIGYFVKYINQNAPNENAFVAVTRLTEKFVNRREFDSAVFVYNTFKPLFPLMYERIDKIIEILQNDAPSIAVRNLGPTINTSQDEWDPNPTPDGKFLYFSASNRNGGMGGTDVWVSYLKDSLWTSPQNLGRGINSTNEETIDNIRADGNVILLSGTFEGTFGKFDIYSKELTPEGWGGLVHLPHPVNSRFTDEGANLTADGMAILFSSDRPGGIGEFKQFSELFHGGTQGNMDLYVSLKQSNGWSEPINLGKAINTPYSERSPFLHPDGRTLYFSSEGHPGLGRLDVFKSVRKSDTSWTEWSEPINLGKQINTAQDDWGYKIAISGDSAFFAGHNRIGGYGGWDLYSVVLPDNIKPEYKVTTISGYVVDLQGKPVYADILWEDLRSGEKVGSLKSNPIDGNYIIALPEGKFYGYYAECKGYYPASGSVDLRSVSSNNSIRKNIVLSNIKQISSEHNPFVINNIFFDFDSHELRFESFFELNRLADFIKNNKFELIQIAGHTDEIGKDTYNLSLSKRRAEEVKKYLVSKGISPNIISTVGYGNSKPISTSNDDKQIDRRVEIQIIK